MKNKIVKLHVSNTDRHDFSHSYRILDTIVKIRGKGQNSDRFVEIWVGWILGWPDSGKWQESGQNCWNPAQNSRKPTFIVRIPPERLEFCTERPNPG